MKHGSVSCGDDVYQIREIPASLMRKHQDISTPNAQMDMLGLCVLVDGQPVGDEIDNIVPLSHLETLINAIADLSGLTEGK